MSTPRTCFLSIATDKYKRKWSYCLESQVRYCEKYEIDYKFVDRIPKWNPTWNQSSDFFNDVCWLKIPFMLRYLTNGLYDFVVWIDSDIFIQKRAPDFRSVLKEGKSLYFAKGKSGRVNAGLMGATSTEAAISFYNKMVELKGMKVPKEDLVKEGDDNSLVIFLANSPQFADSIDILDTKWNNNIDPAIDDYFRHFSAGSSLRYPLKGKLHRLKEFNFPIDD